MSREKQIEDQSEVLYGGRREGGKLFAEMYAKALEDAEAHPENYDDMFAGYENDLNKAVALIEWQKQEIESLTIRMNAFGLAVKSLAEERGKRFLLKENGEVVPLAQKGEWISVEERLPEDEIPVLVFTAKGKYYVGYYYKAVTSPGFTGFYADSCKRDVTHWMPLPEAPKMKDGAE